MIEDTDFRVYYAPFAGDVKALVSLGEDGFYSIYVNSNLPYETQKEAVMHEIAHINHDDFYNGKSIYEVEREAQ